MRWLLLEPYYDGSHRQLVDGLVAQFGDQLLAWTMPARKWKWRMRGSSLEFARRFATEEPAVDGILASSMCNVAELRALLPARTRSLPCTVYFHENQLAYPVQHFDKRDHHFAFTQLHAALCADRVLFNSEFNRSSFLEGLRELAGRMPDYSPGWCVDAIAAKSELLPVPLELAQLLEAPRQPRPRGVTHLVWNHRWEFDKGPELLLAGLRSVIESGVEFTVSVLGQSFQETPPEFEALRALLGERLLHFGFLASAEEYRAELSRADFVLSTASHEFQGLAVIEGAAAGAQPLVPDDLAYREIWPAEWRFRRAEFGEKLIECVRSGTGNMVQARKIAAGFDWLALRKRWAKVLEATHRVQN